MGVCKYCGQSAGLLKSQHKECETKHNDNFAQMVNLTKEAIVENKDFPHLNSQLIHLSKSGYVSKNEIKQAVLRGCQVLLEKPADQSTQVDASS